MPIKYEDLLQRSIELFVCFVRKSFELNVNLNAVLVVVGLLVVNDVYKKLLWNLLQEQSSVLSHKSKTRSIDMMFTHH